MIMAVAGLSGTAYSKPLRRAKPSAAMREGFEKYVKAVSDENLDIHSIMVIQHGKVLEEKWWEGHSRDEAHEMYSVSKSFTSIAVGILVDEGKISLEDQVLSFFPDQAPEFPSEKMKQMKVKHLLTMNTGFAKSPGKNAGTVSKFLSLDPDYLPGTHFCYCGCATYMLSAIVQKVSGEKLLDFLKPRLFEPLGIENPKWRKSNEGITMGSSDLRIRTEDMARFGLMLLHKGKWLGRRIVSARWIEEASSWKSESRPSGSNAASLSRMGITFENSDWRRGYGYQFWISSHNAFRATGAFGQFIIVIPDKDAVIVHTAKTAQSRKQAALDLIWKYIYPAL